LQYNSKPVYILKYVIYELQVPIYVVEEGSVGKPSLLNMSNIYYTGGELE